MRKTTVAKSIFGGIGHLQTAYGLGQAAVAFVLSGFAGWLAGMSAPVFMAIAMFVAVCTAILFRIAPRYIATTILALVALAGLVLTWFNYDADYENYVLELHQPAIGSYRLKGEDSEAVGAAIMADVSNGNKFPIWIKIRRLTISIDGKLGQKDKDGREGQLKPIPPGDGIQLFGGYVMFDEPTDFRNSKFATIEFEACYGRSKEKLNKAIGLKREMTIVRYAGDVPGLLMQSDTTQDFDCD